MQIIVIADIHSQIDQLPMLDSDLKAADLVLLTGDVTNFGRRKEAERILDAIQPHAKALYAVPGNCDYPEVEEVLTEQGLNLDGRGKTLNGLGLIGLGGSLPAPGGTPNEYSESELGQHLEQAAADIDLNQPFLLISHQPPINTSADQVRPGEHVGSQQVRDFIEKHQPLACLTGHIHEGVGIDQIGKTKVINPGPLHTGRYGFLEWADGILTAELRGHGA
ncbi:MAG: metallophosphoesterase [Anaerolineales bacterium]